MERSFLYRSNSTPLSHSLLGDLKLFCLGMNFSSGVLGDVVFRVLFAWGRRFRHLFCLGLWDRGVLIGQRDDQTVLKRHHILKISFLGLISTLIFLLCWVTMRCNGEKYLLAFLWGTYLPVQNMSHTLLEPSLDLSQPRMINRGRFFRDYRSSLHKILPSVMCYVTNAPYGKYCMPKILISNL